MAEHDQDGLVNAFVLDGAGGGRPLGWAQVRGWEPGQGPIWVHLDFTHPQAQTWLRDGSGLDPLVVDALTGTEVRPRCARVPGGLLVSLRGVNMNPGAHPEDMVSIRMFCDGERLISARSRPLLSVRDMVARLEGGQGPQTVEFLVTGLAERLIARMSDVVADLDERIDLLEEGLLEGGGQELRGGLLSMRREVLKLRRYLAPQREALARLSTETVPWLSDRGRLAVRETGDRLTRYVEDLDTVKERASVTYDELASRLSEQLNARMYVLSMVAGLFLPLGFLTGLLGINVGGIPWADNPLGFLEVVALLLVIVLVQVVAFRRLRWL